MIVKLLTERHLEFLSLKEGCTGSSESTLVKMSNCWKSHALAHFCLSGLLWVSRTICSNSDPSCLLSSDRKQNTTYTCARDM